MIDSFLGRSLDNLLLNRISRFRDPFRASEERETYFSAIEQDFKTDAEFYQVSFGLFDALDTKTTAVLTHVSLLVALVGVLLSARDLNLWYKTALSIELVVYLSLTCLCMRCIRFLLPNKLRKDSHSREVYKEIIRRWAIYTIVSDITILATFSLIFVVIAHFVIF